ncbi:MAG: hypothetical protein WAX43_07425, partial [Lactococcus chungangensis]
QSWFTDARFATSLTNLTNDSGITNDVNALKQQAFALSYGYIQSLDISTFSATGYYSTLLDFTAIDANYPYFWLRSAGYYYYRAGAVDDGDFDYNPFVYRSLPVRPALAIQLD